MPDSPAIAPLLTGTLRCDRSLSMELYVTHLERCLPAACAEAGFHPPRFVVPSETGTEGKIRKQLLRYSEFPKVVNQSISEARKSGGVPVVHVTDHSNGHLCRFASPTIVTVHDLTHFEGRFLGTLQHMLWHWRMAGIRKARHLAAVSGHVARGLIEKMGIPAHRVHVVHNGISEAFSQVPATFESAASQKLQALPEGSWKILHVGSNQQRKNLPTLLRAVALLRKAGHPVRLLKAGPPLLAEPDLLELAGDLEISDRILDLGPLGQEELNEVYRGVDVVSFPSTVEGFGWPAVEAQQCGAPIVLADNSCLREVGGEGPVYHPNFDEQALAEALRRCCEDSAFRSEIIRDGLENCRRFSWKTHAQKLIELMTLP